MTERIDKPLTADIAEESIWILREKISENECYFAEHDRYPKGVESDYQNALYVAIEALEKQATSEWIPVSEGLPEGENEVLVTVSGKLNNITFDNAIEIGFYCEIDGWIINGYLDWATPQVTAWQPLPEPWKGEVNE